MKLFGSEWSHELMRQCSKLDVPPDWPLAVFALESGFNPDAVNKTTMARGLFQKMPGRDATGTRILYAVSCPMRQMKDAFAFWRAMRRSFMGTAPFKSRAELYTANFAPARLRLIPEFGDATVLYSLANHHAAYKANINLDRTKRGAILVADLDRELERAVGHSRARYDAELAAALAATDTSPTDV